MVLDVTMVRQVQAEWRTVTSSNIIPPPPEGSDVPAAVVVPEELDFGVDQQKPGGGRRWEGRSGRKYRGKIDRCLSWNVDTLKSTRPDKDEGGGGAVMPPGRLEEHRFSVASGGYAFVALQGHRWQFTGVLKGAVSGFSVHVAGARRQGAPEGLLMAFNGTWSPAHLSNQIIPLRARIQTIPYWHPQHLGHIHRQQPPLRRAIDSHVPARFNARGERAGL